MIKNILSVLIFLFTISFLFLVTNTYFSNNQQIMIKKNREKILQTIQNKINGLPILVNDTENVIEYNSGFDEDKNNIKRNFWKLFKKND